MRSRPLQEQAAIDAAAAHALTHGSFVIPASAFAELRRTLWDWDPETLLSALVTRTQLVAWPPVSRFSVGAAALGSSGAVYLGVNLEFRGTPLNSAVHAEQFAVTLGRRAREERLTHLATSAVPCGHCRQWLYELPQAEAVCVLVGCGAARPLAQLLPDAFGPDSLLPGDRRRLLGAVHNGVQLNAAGRAALATWRGEAASEGAGAARAAARVEAAYAALSCANAAHVPYSACPAGLALLSASGAVAAGSGAESAAYNPTISPLQAALIAAYADAGVGAGAAGEWAAAAAAEAVLVELQGAAVSHEGVARQMLASITPDCTLHVLHCEDFRASRL
jgi:cytidine deaminase